MSVLSARSEASAGPLVGVPIETIPRTADYIACHAALHPDRTAIEHFGDHISYARLDNMLRKVTVALSRYRLPVGSRVCVAIESKLPNLVILMACDNLGLVTCSLSVAEGDSALPALHGAGLLVTDRPKYWKGARSRLMVDAQWIERTRQLATDGYEQLCVPARPAMPLRLRRSSGTTGHTKLMVATRRAEEYRSRSDLMLMGMSEQSRYWPTLGFDVGSVLTQSQLCLRLGGTLVITLSIPGQVHELIVRERITHLRLFQPELREVLASLPADWTPPPGLTLILGAAPIGRALWDEVLTRLASRIVYTYNSNESGPIASMAPDGRGVVRPGVALEVVDDDDRPLPFGEAGHLRIRTPALPNGYLGDPEGTRAVFRKGWFYPNDIGLLERPRVLRLIDRRQDVINVGGRKLPGRPYAMALMRVPGVVDAHVTSLVTERGQSECVAFVVLDAAVDRAELPDRFAPVHLPHYGRVAIQVVEALPRTHNGKVSREGILALYDGAACRHVGE